MKETILKQDLQYQVRRRETVDTASTNRWLRKQGIDASSLTTTPTLLLQAQQQAHAALKSFCQLLTTDERNRLKRFTQKMNNEQCRKKMAKESAYPILKITRKINRQLFKNYKSLGKGN